VKALDSVNLKLHEGEVLGLCGENGAGKSTLIKIVTGVLKPDEGEVLVHGVPRKFASPRQAFAAGISAVHQERNLISTFSVAENVLLDRMTQKADNIVRTNELEKEAQKYLDLVKLKVSPAQNVEELSVAQKQILEIARALSMDAKIVLLDEPTASISMKDSDLLIEIVRDLTKQGYSFIYVSHKLGEIFQVCDSVCVIRDGKNAGDQKFIGELNNDELITMMVGRRERTNAFDTRDMTGGEVVLEACDIAGKENLHCNSFKLHKGEILGWYGLVGSGRTELAREIVGLDPVVTGKVKVNGEMLRIDSVKTAMEKGHIAYASESRNEEGLFLIHSVRLNIASSVWRKLSTLGFIKKPREIAVAAEYIDRLQIKTPGQEQMVNNLSGGNRQKVSMAKVLATNPQILIFDEPTVGIDIKTKAEIHRLIWDISQQGISVILISSDMPELISLADRILVFSGGVICGEIISGKDYDVVSKQIMRTIVEGKEKLA
jgi:ribose transport system ATP-binding protein